MKIRLIQIERRHQCWTCCVVFTVTTARQFTDEQRQVASEGRNPLSATIKAWLTARRWAREIQARPGERAAKGWTSKRHAPTGDKQEATK